MPPLDPTVSSGQAFRRGGVAFYHATFAWGGGERVVVEQVRALEPLGVPVDLWLTTSRGEGPIGEVARAANPYVRHVGVARSPGAIARTLWRYRYDAVVTYDNLRAYRGIRRARWLPFARRPVVFETVHSRYAWDLCAFDGLRARVVDAWLLTH